MAPIWNGSTISTLIELDRNVEPKVLWATFRQHRSKCLVATITVTHTFTQKQTFIKRSCRPRWTSGVVVHRRCQVVRQPWQSQTLLRTGPRVTVTGRGREMGQKFSQDPLLPVCVWPVTFLHFPPVTATRRRATTSPPLNPDLGIASWSLTMALGTARRIGLGNLAQDLARRVWNSRQSEECWWEREEDGNNGPHEISSSVVFYIHGMENCTI